MVCVALQRKQILANKPPVPNKKEQGDSYWDILDAYILYQKEREKIGDY